MSKSYLHSPTASYNKIIGHNRNYVLDVDIGGTFTDAVVCAKGRPEFFKVETTPHDMSLCIKQVLEKALEIFDEADITAFLGKTEIIRFSTSISTNLLIESKGQRCGLLLSAGWRDRFLKQLDFLEGGYSIISEDDVFEINGDIGPFIDGALKHSVENEVAEQVGVLLEQGVNSIIISLFRAETHPKKEQRIREIIHKYYLPHYIRSVPVLLGSQISRTSDYMLRTYSAIVNAYCHRPIALHYFRVEEFLRQQGFPRAILAVNVTGGTTRIANTLPIQTVNSGAAASVYGVSFFIHKSKQQSAISIDLGGTSTEIGLVHDGEVRNVYPLAISGVPLDLSFPVLASIGIGGGSIATVDKKGRFHVGPRSAGAFPGPACYDIGGSKPTLTDALLVLGYLNQDYFLGGTKRLSLRAAQEIFDREICRSTGLTCEEAARRVKDKAVEIIGAGIRAAVKDIDFDDDSQIPLFALGGAGGCLGSHIADFLGLAQTYILRHGSVSGAFGSGKMDIVHVYESPTHFDVLQHETEETEICQQINRSVSDLQHVAFKDMRGEGFSAEDLDFRLELELTDCSSRILGSVELSTPFIFPPHDLDFLRNLARAKYTDLSAQQEDAFCVSRIRLKAIGIMPQSGYFQDRSKKTSQVVPKGSRPFYSGDGDWTKAAVYDWDCLTASSIFKGPLILESPDTTVFVPSGKQLIVDETLTGIIQEEE